MYKIHKLIEAKELHSISQKEMAGRLGISDRTYVEWLRKTNEPLAMKALLDLLCFLEDDDIVQIVRFWENNKDKN